MREPPPLNLHAPAAVTPDRYLYPGPAVLFVHAMTSPEPRSLAVLCYDNALRLLTLEGAEARLSMVAFDYLPSVVGGQLSNVEPNPGQHVVAYLQSRRLVLFNLASKTHAAHRIIDDTNMEEIAVAGAFASLDPPVVIAQVEDATHFEEGYVEARLISCELGASGALRRGSLELDRDAEKGADWGAGRGLVAAFKAGYLEVFDAFLSPQRNHPLGKALRETFEERKALRFAGIRFHPARDLMVFGLLERDREGSRDFSLFQADFRGGAVAIEPICRALDVGTFEIGSFSPGGEWVFFRVGDEGQTYFFAHHLLASSPQVPLPLGPFPAPKSAHFAQNPLSLVVLDDDLEVVCAFPLPSPQGA
jgi:hypothetical protein